MEFKLVKIAVYVPSSHAEAVRKALAESGCGHIGNYDYCSFSVNGIGRFRPLDGASPFVGKVGKIEEVEEERVETICHLGRIAEVVKALKAVHPYDEPAVDIYPLINEDQF